MKKAILSAMMAGAIGSSAVASAQNGISVKFDHLTPEMLITMNRVGGAKLSPDGKTAVYTISEASLKANKIYTDLYAIGLDGQNAKRLTKDKNAEVEPVWINGGKRIAFLSNKSGSMQLWTMLPDGSDLHQITDVKGGITGFKYSPDESMLLYTKDIDLPNKVKERYKDLDKASGQIYDDLLYKHWDEWVTTVPHPFLAAIADGKMITEGKDMLEGEPYEAPMKPFSDVNDFSFTPDGKEIAYASRKKTGMAYAVSTNSDIYVYNIASGKTRNITEGMMGYDTNPVYSPDGKMIAWISMEEDGYESDLMRLFVMDLKTGKKTHLDKGFEYNVGHLQWTPDSKSIYFTACKEAETQIWSISVKNGKIRQITSGEYDYVGFDVQNGKMLAMRQSMQVPTDLYRVNLKNGEATQITHENRTFLNGLAPIKVEKRWMTTTNGEKMLTWVVFPPNFDPNKKYPSILYCQGGPQSTISQFFSYRWNIRLMAEQGYIVILPNRHGVPGFGKAWNEQISGDYGGQNMRDYLTAADEMKKEPYIAKDKMGCVGASYGGFSVYWLAGHHNKRFACFIAHAGIFNLEAQYLETEEKWFANKDMGGPFWDKNNKVAQRTFQNSPHKFVGEWDTPILVIHGGRDYRILWSQGMQAFDAAKMRGIPCEMLLFPDENHWILKPQNALLWQRTFFRWLDKWLK